MTISSSTDTETISYYIDRDGDIVRQARDGAGHVIDTILRPATADEREAADPHTGAIAAQEVCPAPAHDYAHAENAYGRTVSYPFSLKVF